jgi:hypothetical protein
VPTPFGLFPPVNPGTVLNDLVTGTQQGIGAFVGDIGSAGSGLSLGTPTSISGFVAALQAANTHVVNAVTSAVSTGNAVLLPTADFATAAVVSVLSYDVNLFLNGILQAVNGGPVGLVNAVGDPIAADFALFTIAGGFEAIVLASAAHSIVADFTSL